MGEEETVREVAENGTNLVEKSRKNEVVGKEEDGRDVEEGEMDVEQGKKDTKEEEKGKPETETMEDEILRIGNGESKEKVDGSGVEGGVDVAQEGNAEEKADEGIQEKGSKKHLKRRSGGGKINNKKNEVKEKNEDPKTPLLFAMERPVRQRKSVERLAVSLEKEAVKEVNIVKGRGTALKDIPNVAYKLSRKRTDDTLKLLHTILFARRGKAFQVKNNISRFSGFVWNQNEEKQKTKVKEKFDKCTKEKLVEFCDVLNIPTAKANIRKEDLVMKLIDFLVAPHATTNELLADKEQASKGKRRRRVVESASPSGDTPAQSSAKRRRKTENTSTREVKKSKPEAAGELEDEDDDEEENNATTFHERTKDDMHGDSDNVKENQSQEDSEEDSRKKKRGSKKSAGKAKNEKITTPKKANPLPKRTPTDTSPRRSKVDHSADTSYKTFSRKKKNEEVVNEKSSTPKRSKTEELVNEKSSTSKRSKTEELVNEKSSTPKRSAMKDKNGKKVAKGKDKPKEDNRRPTDDELRNAVCQILNEVDFNTATFSDILKQIGGTATTPLSHTLAGRFKSDLGSRKSSIKLMIEDELAKLAEESDEEQEESDVEKEETRPCSQRVEA